MSFYLLDDGSQFHTKKKTQFQLLYLYLTECWISIQHFLTYQKNYLLLIFEQKMSFHMLFIQQQGHSQQNSFCTCDLPFSIIRIIIINANNKKQKTITTTLNLIYNFLYKKYHLIKVFVILCNT